MSLLLLFSILDDTYFLRFGITATYLAPLYEPALPMSIRAKFSITNPCDNSTQGFLLQRSKDNQKGHGSSLEFSRSQKRVCSSQKRPWRVKKFCLQPSAELALVPTTEELRNYLRTQQWIALQNVGAAKSCPSAPALAQPHPARISGQPGPKEDIAQP